MHPDRRLGGCYLELMVKTSQRKAPGPPGLRMTLRVKFLLVLAALLLLAVILVDWLALLETGPFDLSQIALAPEAFVELIRGWGAWGVAGAIGLMVLHSFVPFPAEYLALANGMVFGLLWGTLITWSGAMLGAWAAFGLARACGKPFVDRLLSAPHRERLEGWSGDHGWSTLLAARLMPVVAFNLINYAAGLVNVSWWTFTWTTAVGILPLTFLMVLLGDQMTAMPAWAWLLFALAAVGLWWLLRRLQRPVTGAPVATGSADDGPTVP
jgi:uncharacterized membrane protein YdjX (TVP38/TMEM64 family)